MRILQLCKKFPFPLKDGESIAVNSLSKSLHHLGCEMTLLSMNTSKHYFNPKELPSGFNHYNSVFSVDVDNRLKPLEAFRNLFSKESYHISRFISPDFEQKLTFLLENNEYDIIQLETLYLAPYIPLIRKFSDAIISMRAHNVEHEIWQRITDNTRTWGKKWYLKHLTTKLKQYELDRLNAYDILLPITQRDLDSFYSFGFQKEAVVIPIGIDMEAYVPDYKTFDKVLSLSFIGSLDWMPNQEGLKWFLEFVWPGLRKKYPDLKLHVAGRNCPEWVFKLTHKNVITEGEVPDAPSFINKHSIMVVPLLSGSGMRAKILEAMALGKVVITTSLGLEGIKAKNNAEVLVADRPEEFIKAIRFCYKQGKKLAKIGRQARTFVENDYSSKQIAKKLLNTYSSMVVPVF